MIVEDHYTFTNMLNHMVRENSVIITTFSLTRKNTNMLQHKGNLGSNPKKSTN